MTSLLLAALQGMGEYGALTGATSGGTSSGTAMMASKFAQATTWVSDHQTAVIVGAVAGTVFLFWATRART